MPGNYKIGREAYMREYRLKHRKRLYAHNKEWRENNKELARMHAATHRYKISRIEYQKLMAQAHCEICNELPSSGDKWLSIDHSHVTGKIRGMLCRKCNSAIGLAMDDPALLRKMAAYLESR